MTIGAQVLIHYLLQSQEADSRVINLAGRQRMLSQNIAKNVLLLKDSLSSSQREEVINRLRNLSFDLERSQLGLLNGDPDLQLPKTESRIIIGLFEKNAPYYEIINKRTKAIIEGQLSPAQGENFIQAILTNEGPFLKTMDEIVYQYDLEAKQKIEQLSFSELIIASITLLIIILEILFIIRPVFKRFREQNGELHTANKLLANKNEKIERQNQRYLEINQALIKAKQKAEVAAVTKAKFLSNMSHEIRTPMNAVVGVTNLLMEGDPKEDQIELLQTLHFSSEHLLNIINDILDLSKIESGGFSLEKTDINIRQLIRNIQYTLMPKAIQKDLAFETTIDDDIPKLLQGDPVRLSQILLNLGSNAIKFTEKGKVSLHIKLEALQGKKALLNFEVVDTGIGIPKDKQEKIFDSFSQADTNTTRIYGGTGLGLTITKKLLELHNSKIYLESEIGKGSIFSFSLLFPISKTLEMKGKETLSYIKQYSSENFKKILVVEDNKINQLIISRFLKKWKIKFDIAEDGLEAVEKVQTYDYGLVLMDLQMPNMDGYEATRTIRQLKDSKYKELPIIALSASAVLEIRDQAISAGMNGFMTKPFKPNELFETIHSYMLA